MILEQKKPLPVGAAPSEDPVWWVFTWNEVWARSFSRNVCQFVIMRRKSGGNTIVRLNKSLGLHKLVESKPPVGGT